MSNETENENRRRIEKLESDRKTDKTIQEKNMQILESNMKELLADNRAAFERLRADVYRGVLAVIGAMGLAVAVLKWGGI